jgi:hypothetical protein
MFFFFSTPQQNRHPACPGVPWERSAAQIYLHNNGFTARSRRTPAALILPHAARSFSTTEARTGRTRHGLSLGTDNQELSSIVLCPTIKCVPKQVLFSGFVVKKLRAAWVR